MRISYWSSYVCSSDLAGDADPLVALLGDVNRVLTGHRVGDQQRLVRTDGVADRDRLLHRLLVAAKAADGVDAHHVVALAPPCLHGTPGDRHLQLAETDRQYSRSGA